MGDYFFFFGERFKAKDCLANDFLGESFLAKDFLAKSSSNETDCLGFLEKRNRILKSRSCSESAALENNGSRAYLHLKKRSSRTRRVRR